jgi:glutamate racemase
VVVSRDLPIGMFDSGVGGLTVARAVIDLLPHEDLVYFGDTARFPYGPRSPEEIRRFAIEITDFLVSEGVKMVVVACNSAESTAFYDRRYELPVVTVIEPGIKAALAATRNRRIGMIATEATVRSGAYDLAIERLRANVTLVSAACPKFVEFVERGDTTSDAVLAAAEDYLAPLKEAEVDSLILGCTHYPFLSGVLQYVMGEDVVLISSAEATANEVYARLLELDLLKHDDAPGLFRFVASSADGLDDQLGRRFLGPEFGPVEYRSWIS